MTPKWLAIFHAFVVLFMLYTLGVKYGVGPVFFCVTMAANVVFAVIIWYAERE